MVFGPLYLSFALIVSLIFDELGRAPHSRARRVFVRSFITQNSKLRSVSCSHKCQSRNVADLARIVDGEQTCFQEVGKCASFRLVQGDKAAFSQGQTLDRDPRPI